MSASDSATVADGGLLPILTRDEVGRLIRQLWVLADYVPSARHDADELAALLSDRTAPPGTLKPYLLAVCPWENRQLRYQISRRVPGGVEEVMETFLNPPMATSEAISYGVNQASERHQIPKDQLDLRLIAMPAA
ncbi:MAG TPA: hypothetical protein VL551_10585 [Actinospica sp.]|jgi:hypothetical protein|nr:hypothetical protein [Actinospica sp.]